MMQPEHALHNLTVVRRDLARLIALEATWFDASFQPDDRIGHRAEWANTIDRFSAVVDAYASGQIDGDVAAQVIDVARLLVSVAPVLGRMHLRQPSADDLRRLGILSVA